jgi:O-Antigen ligase
LRHNRGVVGEQMRERFGWLLAAAVAGAWAAFLVALQTGAATVAKPTTVTLGVPAGVLIALALVRRPLPRQLLWAAGSIALLSLALYLAQKVIPKPLLVLALPAGVAAGIACRKRPEVALLGLFAVASAFGVIDAFTPVPPSKLADLLLGGLWLGVAWRRLVGGDRFELRLVPGIVLLIAFALVTFAQVVAAPSFSFGIHTFISTGLYLLTVVLVGASELDEGRLTTIAKGIVAIALLAAAYAVLRDIIGPAGKERAIASLQPFNFKDGKLLLFGATESRHQLGLWCALVVPFCAGMATVLGGRWRLAALAVIPLCAVAFISSESRAALVGALAGLAVVLALHSMGRAFPGPRLGAVLAAAVVVIGGGGAAIVLSGGNGNATTKKFTVVLHPSSDAAYQARKAKWNEALRDIRKQPMGHGLGTANQLQQQQGRFVSIGSFSIDNSYLRVGYEQGILPALLYIAGLLALTATLIRRAAVTPDPARAGPALAAAGAMVSYVIVLYPSNAFDGYTALAAWLIAGVGIAPFLAPVRSASRSAERRSSSLAAARRSGGPMLPGLGSTR